MISTILAQFGYAKVPKAAVLLSMEQELFFDKLLKAQKGSQTKEVMALIQNHLYVQKTLTELLRSGRRLS